MREKITTGVQRSAYPEPSASTNKIVVRGTCEFHLRDHQGRKTLTPMRKFRSSAKICPSESSTQKRHTNTDTLRSIYAERTLSQQTSSTTPLTSRAFCSDNNGSGRSSRSNSRSSGKVGDQLWWHDQLEFVVTSSATFSCQVV